MAEERRFADRTLGDLTVRVDRHTCIASENCTELAPEVFEVAEDSIVRVKEDAPADVDRDRLIEACRVCPVDALILLSADGEQIVP